MDGPFVRKTPMGKEAEEGEKHFIEKAKYTHTHRRMVAYSISTQGWKARKAIYVEENVGM